MDRHAYRIFPTMSSWSSTVKRKHRQQHHTLPKRCCQIKTTPTAFYHGCCPCSCSCEDGGLQKSAENGLAAVALFPEPLEAVSSWVVPSVPDCIPAKLRADMALLTVSIGSPPVAAAYAVEEFAGCFPPRRSDDVAAYGCGCSS